MRLFMMLFITVLTGCATSAGFLAPALPMNAGSHDIARRAMERGDCVQYSDHPFGGSNVVVYDCDAGWFMGGQGMGGGLVGMNSWQRAQMQSYLDSYQLPPPPSEEEQVEAQEETNGQAVSAALKKRREIAKQDAKAAAELLKD